LATRRRGRRSARKTCNAVSARIVDTA
jgi:hypothetical protein